MTVPGYATTHSMRQQTIKQSVTFVGRGIHSGEPSVISIYPAPDNSGIRFVAGSSTEEDALIAARWFNVSKADGSTILTNDASISVATVEHLLAALYGLGIDNATIEIDGPEVPILDGSAAPYVKLLQHAGIVQQNAPRRVIYIFRPVEVRDGDRFAMLLPSMTPRITVSIDFPGTLVGNQTQSVRLTPELFASQIAPARTFGFERQLEAMRKRGLILGASIKNALLVRDEDILSDEPLRFSDEFVCHKILDVVGDLALVGAPIYGHVYCHKPGHYMNFRLLDALFDNRESWTYVTVDDMDALYGIQTAPVVCHPNQFANVCQQ